MANSVFALAAIAMDEEHVQSYIAAADKLKLEFFGSIEMTFHEPNMRNFAGPYYFGGNRDRQQAFDSAIDSLITNVPMTAFGVAIRKEGFRDQFLETEIDPYLPFDAYAVTILMLLERYVDFLLMRTDRRMGRVTFESQGPKEDALHQLEYARLLIDGTQWVPSSAFQHAIEAGARFAPKAGSSPLELADMLSRELWEWVRGGCAAPPKRWDLFGPTIYCRGDRQMGTFGVKVFPDADFRERIDRHRASISPRN